MPDGTDDYRPRPDDHLVEPFFEGLEWRAEEEAAPDGSPAGASWTLRVVAVTVRPFQVTVAWLWARVRTRPPAGPDE